MNCSPSSSRGMRSLRLACNAWRISMAKKLRTEQPPKYKSYKSFKPYLRREFDHTCVYCDVWESEMGGKKSFHIDHYRPKEKPQFKQLIAEYTNLLYSCRDCNEFKDDYWPNPLEWLFGL